MTGYYPNFLPATLRACLVSADPKLPSRGDRHVHIRECVLLGFNVGDDGRLDAVTLTPRRPDETLLVNDTSGRLPTWTLLDAPAPGDQPTWVFTRWADCVAEVIRRYEAAQSPSIDNAPVLVPELHAELPVPAIGGMVASGVIGDSWGTSPQPWKESRQ